MIEILVLVMACLSLAIALLNAYLILKRDKLEPYQKDLYWNKDGKRK